MEHGGFTLVKEGDDNMASKKHKVADGINTTMLGITAEEAQKIYRQTLKRGGQINGLEDDAGKRQKTDVNMGLYKHQTKNLKKEELENLRENFDDLKR